MQKTQIGREFVNVQTATLPAPKRAPTEKDGRTTSHHTVVSIAAYFQSNGAFKPKEGAAAPGHWHGFINNINVHLRDGATPDQVKRGGTFRVEICATVVKGTDGKALDGNVYVNVFPVTEGTAPAKRIRVNVMQCIAKEAEMIYHGRSNGAVVIVPAPTAEELAVEAKERANEKPAATNLRDSSNLSVAERRDAVSLGGAPAPCERRRC